MGTGSACQANEPDRREPAAVGALRRELLYGDAEDGSQARDLHGSESAWPAVTAAFSGAHGGGGGPVHQLAEFCLRPPLAQAQGPDVRAGKSELLRRNHLDTPPPSAHHVPAGQVTLSDVTAPGRLTYRFAASIASAQ